MFEAQLLISKDEAYSVYSPWFPRGADNAEFTVEILHENGGATLTVDSYTKASHDAGDGSASGDPTLSQSGQGTASQVHSVLKDMVRYKFTITKSSAAGEWVLFRMLPPKWYDTVKV